MAQTSLIGKVSGFFSRTSSESDQFRKFIKNKPLQVIYSVEKLKKVVDTFDEDPERKILLLYVHSKLNPANLNSFIFKNILNNFDLSAFINSNFHFYPVLTDAKDLKLLRRFFGSRDVPCFLFFRWGQDNKLKLLRIVNLNTKPATDQMMETMADVIELTEEQEKFEQQIEANIAGKRRQLEELEQEHMKKMNEIFNNPGQSNRTPNQ